MHLKKRDSEVTHHFIYTCSRGGEDVMLRGILEDVAMRHTVKGDTSPDYLSSQIDPFDAVVIAYYCLREHEPNPRLARVAMEAYRVAFQFAWRTRNRTSKKDAQGESKSNLRIDILVNNIRPYLEAYTSNFLDAIPL